MGKDTHLLPAGKVRLAVNTPSGRKIPAAYIIGDFAPIPPVYRWENALAYEKSLR